MDPAEVRPDPLRLAACRWAIAVWDAWAAVHRAEQWDGLAARRGVGVEKWVGPGRDGREPPAAEWQKSRSQKRSAPAEEAPYTPDEVPFAAQSFVAVVAPARWALWQWEFEGEAPLAWPLALD